MGPVLCVHHDDQDGIAAAWAVERALPAGVTIDFYRTNYGKPLNGWLWRAINGASSVYIVDFSFSREELTLICKRAGAAPVHLIDHHKTAIDALSGWTDCPPNLKLTLDASMSGCELTWATLLGGPMPEILKYVGDRDMWAWKLPDSRMVNTWIGAFAVTMEGFRQCVFMWNRSTHSERVTMAQMIDMSNQNRIIRPHVYRSREVMFSGYRARVVNASIMPSEIGEAILLAHADAQLALMYFDTDKLRVATLRSRVGADVDVSAICVARGGGGHKHAAGFQIRLRDDVEIVTPADDQIVKG